MTVSHRCLKLLDRFLSDRQDMMPIVERYVVLMYDRASDCMTVNKARKDLFNHKGRSIESIPPTADALLHHTKMVVYQAGYCWGQAMVPVQDLPSPGEWGWCKNAGETWEPFWMSLPQAGVIVSEPI